MMKRREFLEAGLAAGTGLLLAHRLQGEEPASKPSSDTLNIAVIGCGDIGQTLIHVGALIPDVRFQAICDIWEYRRQTTLRYLSKYKYPVAEYADYRQMLEKEKGLHAVLIATPDFVHAEQTNACLKAGLHVYCEAMMANSIEAARSMVKTAKETRKLLQIGYQRRSNPRYHHVLEKLIDEAKLLGQPTQVNTQWAHWLQADRGSPAKYQIPNDVLKQYGYGSMREFRNWQFSSKFGGGPLALHVSHQIDVVSWFLNASPKSITAVGGIDHHPDHQCYDTITAAAEYVKEDRPIRAMFQLLTSTSAGGGKFEHFMGTEASVKISEAPEWTKVYHEPFAPSWERLIELQLLVKELPLPVQLSLAASKPVDPSVIRSMESGKVTPYSIPVVLEKSPFQVHLEDFLSAVRGKGQLSCPAEEAFRSEALVWKICEAIKARKTIDLKPEDFTV